MTDTPTVRYSGQGTRRQATELGQTISRGIERAVAGRGALHIDTLRVRVPAGASARDIERAIGIAVERQISGRRT